MASNLLSEMPSHLHLTEKPGLGRVLINTAVIKAGDEVLVDTPLILYPTALPALDEFCCRCFRFLRPEVKQIPCHECKVARFCSQKCHSSHHPILCRGLASIASGDVGWSEDIFFLLSSYCLQPHLFRELMDLPSKPSDVDHRTKKLYSKIASFFPPGADLEQFPVQIAASILSIKKMNSLYLEVNRRVQKLGACVAGVKALGIFRWGSILKHNCMPNLALFDYTDFPEESKGNFIYKALDDIEVGSELTISYVDVTWGRKTRQSNLIVDYNLKCHCERCEAELLDGREVKGSMGKDEINKEMGTFDTHQTGGLKISAFFDKCICKNCRGYVVPASSGLTECSGCGIIHKRHA